ncbi:hypothetical protein ACERNI_12065 [Camelimonas sp. ID_303_24]
MSGASALAQSGPQSDAAAPAGEAASARSASDRIFKVSGGQTSVPAGVTIQVRKIVVGEDATVVHLVASFDSRRTSRVNLNEANATLDLGDGQRLQLRQPDDNRYLTIANGQTIDAELVFPGRIPDGTKQVALSFNAGNEGDDLNAPGVTLRLSLAEAR